MKQKISLGPEFQAAFVRRVAAGDSLMAAARALGTSGPAVAHRMKSDTAFAVEVRRAEAERGPLKPSGRPAPVVDFEKLFAALRRGNSLEAACKEAGCSRHWLGEQRKADAALDRRISACRPRQPFDEAAKALAIQSLREGQTFRAVSRRLGYNHDWLGAHIRSDSGFAAMVREAIGDAEDPVARTLRSTLTKAKFDEVLAIIPHYDTIEGACRVAGVRHGAFRHLLRCSPQRKSAFDTVVSALDPTFRGRGRPRRGRTEADFDRVVEEMVGGACLFEACRLARVPVHAVRVRRRKDEAYDRAIWRAGHQLTTAGRRLLKRRAAQLAVFEKLSSGAPQFCLGRCGLPGWETVRSYAKVNPDFATELLAALKVGRDRRALTSEGRYDAALKALTAGVKPGHLGQHDLIVGTALTRRAQRDPAFALRLQNALLLARGDIAGEVELTVEQLVERVAERLPKRLLADERQDCLNQAWIDAVDGTLRPGNMSTMAKRYAAASASSFSPLYLDASGDVRSNYMD